MRRFLLFLSLFFSIAVANGAVVEDRVALDIMKRVAGKVVADTVGVESLNAGLYIREYVNVERKNYLLGVIPGMTRFDRGENDYLAELLYDVSCIYNSLPNIKRVASRSTFMHSSGEMEKVLFFMSPQLFGERLFDANHLSPFYPSNLGYYNYSVDYSSISRDSVKIFYEARFDNIQLFKSGWVVVSLHDMLPTAFYAQGWDEQCEFTVECSMGKAGIERYVVHDIVLHMDYDFAYNELAIDAHARFDYKNLQPREAKRNLERVYDLSDKGNVPVETLRVGGDECIAKSRKWPLSEKDSLLYVAKGIDKDSGDSGEQKGELAAIQNMLWLVGDKAISSHSLAWGSSDLKISPVLNPSCLSYSTSRGLAYKFSFHFRNSFSQNHTLDLRPMLGYNFKQKEVYWRLAGSFGLNPMKRSALVFDAGRESSIYSSVMLDDIESAAFDTLRISSMPFVYYRDFYFKSGFQIEVFNGLELRFGANMYKRTMSGNALGLEVGGVELKRHYRQFAPNFRVTWHPGMYYYINNGSKINMGSLAPRFALDVEQGVDGVFGSHGVYTRAELDMQHKHRLTSSASLYMRLGAGGYFYTRNVYFVDYVFLKNNNLPFDKDDELSGVFQLLDAEWYNSANKYVRANFTYQSPFLFLQKLLPSARIIENEALYGNILFISHLHPYFECGYGVDTPYINTGFFVSFENYSYHRVGFKVSFSLFRN